MFTGNKLTTSQGNKRSPQNTLS